MPCLNIDDRTHFYEMHGSGVPLVLISGLGTSRLFWWKQIDPLSKKYTTITPDNRGVGQSSRVEGPFTVDDMADDIAAILQHIDMGPAHIVGLSMGGFVALKMAIHYPLWVKKLMVVSTSAGGPDQLPSQNEIIELVANADHSDVETYIRNINSAITGPGYMQSNPHDLDQLVKNAQESRLSPDTYLYQLNAINQYDTSKGVSAMLHRIQVPTMVLHGEMDPLVPYDNGKYLADHIGGARLNGYKHIGHMPPIEAAERFNEDATAFFG